MSVSQSVTWVPDGLCKNVRIDVVFVVETPVDQRNIVLDGRPHLPMARGKAFDAAIAKLLLLFVILLSYILV